MSLLAPLQAGCVLAFALLLIAAGWQDLRTMRIANGLSQAIAACFAVWALAGLALGTTSIDTIALSVACAAALFAAGALAFAAGGFGGGDVKLLAAAGLFAGPGLMVDFLAVTALVGGATVRARLRGSLPYGPAIAVGGLWVAASLVVS